MLILKQRYADADLWLGLFRSCKGGRDLAFSSAPQAHLQLDTTEPQQPGPWLQRLSIAKECLGVRGSLPVSLEIR